MTEYGPRVHRELVEHAAIEAEQLQWTRLACEPRDLDVSKAGPGQGAREQQGFERIVIPILGDGGARENVSIGMPNTEIVVVGRLPETVRPLQDDSSAHPAGDAET